MLAVLRWNISYQERSIEESSSIEKNVFIYKNIKNKNVVMAGIFEFRYTSSDEIFFTNSKPNKSLN